MKRIIVFFLVLSLVFSLFTACKYGNESSLEEVSLYFSNSSKDSLVTETWNIEKTVRTNTIELVRRVCDRLFKGPATEGYTAVIPKGVKLRGVSLDKDEIGMVNIDLSKEYYTERSKDAPITEELLARYSIVSTLCQFEEIKKVKIYVDGKDMVATSGKDEIVPPMGEGSVMINSPSSVETKTEKFVTLYFTDKNGVNLYMETRKATMTDNSLEKTVINELIKGPGEDNLVRTFGENVQLISVETTEDVCFVNFSGNFLPKAADDLSAVKVAVYSVVNSLTRLPGIEKVQILIDGKKPEDDMFQLFAAPLERDESLIIIIN